MRWDDGIRQDLGIVLDNAESTQNAVLADMGMRADVDGGDMRALTDENVVAHAHRVEGHDTVVDSHGWAQGTVRRDHACSVWHVST